MSASQAVRIISQAALLSTGEESWQALNSPFRLGPLDHLVPPFIPVAVVFLYAPTTPDMDVIPVNRLQRALTLLLDYYPHLTGRLQINKLDGTPEVSQLGTGAGLFLAECAERLESISQRDGFSLQDLPDGGNPLLPPFDMDMEAICRDPVFAIQHTRFSDGGAALGIRVLHTITDADGFFQLTRDLAELYRGVGSQGEGESGQAKLRQPPCIHSYMHELSGGLMPQDARVAALKYQPALYFLEGEQAAVPGSSEAEAMPTSDSTSPPPAQVCGRFLKFSSAELGALKVQATSPNSSQWISTFDALCAHLYQCVHRARVAVRKDDPSQPALSPPDFLTPINIRERLGKDSFPSPYFPQALLTIFTCMDPEVLLDGPLWQVAKAVHDVTRISAVTESEDIQRTLQWIAAQPDKLKIRQGFRYGTGSLMISQWNKFDIYRATALDNSPILVAPPFTSISLMDGLFYLLPTSEQAKYPDTPLGSGSIEVAMALSEPVWAALDSDPNFRLCR